MKLPSLTITYSLFPSLFLFGETVNTTLEITPEPEFNSIEITLDVPAVGLSSDTSDLSGSLEIELEIDPDSDQVSALTIINGSATGTPLSLSASSFLFGNYDFNSTEIGAEIETLAPPGVVDPATGEFDASEHSLTVNSGTLSGSISIPLLDIDEIVDFDFAALPFGGAGAGTGTVVMTPIGTTPTSKSYDVVVLFPVQIENTVDAMGFEIPITAAGVVKGVGTVSVPITPPDPYLAWTEANSIAGELFAGDENQDGVPNGLQWALGLDAATPPFSALLQSMGVMATTVDFTMTLPAGGSAADLTVRVSANPESDSFVTLAPGSVSSGNPIPAGTSGTVTIRLPKSTMGFVRLSVNAPGN
jgi:hypothetical protein